MDLRFLMCAATCWVFGGVSADAQTRLPEARLIESLRIDGAREGFGAPFGFVRVGANGQIAFADWTSFRIVIYHADGRRLAAVGREGNGPGEFSSVAFRGGRRASFAGGLVGDTLWAYESGPRRLSRFTTSGRVIGTTSVPGPAQLRSRTNPDERLAAFAPTALTRDGEMIGRGTVVRAVDASGVPGTSAQNFTHLVAVSFRDSTFRRVLPLGAPVPSVEVTDRRSGQILSVSAVGHSGPLTATSPDASRVVLLDRVVSANAAEFVLTVQTPTGDTIYSRRHPTTRLPLPQEQVDAQVEAALRDLRAAQGVRWEARTLDDLAARLRATAGRARSGVTGVLAGNDGTTWISTIESEGARTQYYVYDERGNAMFRVFHARAHLMHSADRNNVWVTEYDRDGIPSIVRYRVELSGR